MRDYRAPRRRWLGQSWPRSIYHSPDALPASDAPVPDFPGHRRDVIVPPNQALAAALPQPPHLLETSMSGNRARLFSADYSRKPEMQ